MLGSPGEALCDGCLALACSTSLAEMWEITKTLLTGGESIQQASSCASCRRTIPAIVHRLKCVRCDRAIERASGDPGMLIDGEAVHLVCVRRLATDERPRDSSGQITR